MQYKDSDIAYAAGIFDTIGSINVIHTLTPEEGIDEHCLFVWITSSNFKLMTYLQKFDAVIGKRADGKYKAKWKDILAAKFLSLIIPYLKIKTDQADLGIEFMQYKSIAKDPKTYVLPLSKRLKLLKREDISD